MKPAWKRRTIILNLLEMVVEGTLKPDGTLALNLWPQRPLAGGNIPHQPRKAAYETMVCNLFWFFAWIPIIRAKRQGAIFCIQHHEGESWG